MKHWVNGQWMDEVPAQVIVQTPALRLVSDPQIDTWSLATPTLVDVDATTGPATVILPVSGNIIITKTDGAENNVTITPQGMDTILYQPTAVLTMQGETIHLRKRGTNWDAIG